MKQRWKLKKAEWLYAGEVFWRNGTEWRAVAIHLPPADIRLITKGYLVLVKATKADCSIKEIKTFIIEQEVQVPILIAGWPTPPKMPTPPPSRIIRDYGNSDSWWGRLKDWLNGR